MITANKARSIVGAKKRKSHKILENISHLIERRAYEGYCWCDFELSIANGFTPLNYEELVDSAEQIKVVLELNGYSVAFLDEYYSKIQILW